MSTWQSLHKCSLQPWSILLRQAPKRSNQQKYKTNNETNTQKLHKIQKLRKQDETKIRKNYEHIRNNYEHIRKKHDKITKQLTQQLTKKKM